MSDESELTEEEKKKAKNFIDNLRHAGTVTENLLNVLFEVVKGNKKPEDISPIFLEWKESYKEVRALCTYIKTKHGTDKDFRLFSDIIKKGDELEKKINGLLIKNKKDIRGDILKITSSSFWRGGSVFSYYLGYIMALQKSLYDFIQ
jgi:hypothetical protein